MKNILFILIPILLLFSVKNTAQELSDFIEVTYTPWGGESKFTYHPLFNPIQPPPLGTSKDFLPPSPTAASLGVFGQIPVGRYTGIAQISIPLYEIKHHSLTIPISLNYHPENVKPALFPGSTGLGWSLQAGGTITRVINGLPDYGNAPETAFSLIFNQFGLLKWWDLTSLKKSIEGTRLTEVYGSNPDEYYFNFNNISGKFYADYKNDTIRIQSNQGHALRIIMDRGGRKNISFLKLSQTREPITSLLSIKYNNIVGMNNVLYGFTIIDEYGTKYIFGESDKSVEFSRPGLNQADLLEPIDLICPLSWYLISIEYTDGYKVEFDYEQETVITKTYFTDRVIFEEKSPFTAMYDYSVRSTLINGCYLIGIRFPEGNLEFINSFATEQLDYPHLTSYSDDVTLSANFNHFQYYDDVHFANTEKVSDANNKVVECFLPHKIDEIQLKNISGELIRKITFSYTNNHSERLKLKKVDINGGNNSKQTYQFIYDPLFLPTYDKRAVDMYGHYNGQPIYETQPNQVVRLLKADPSYIKKLMPFNYRYAQAEMLKEIIYPTGGYTTLEYESHDYGSVYEYSPFITTDNKEGNLVAPGIRVKAVRNYSKDKKLLNTRRYHYIKNYLGGGTQSSGILVYTPQFVEKYQNYLIAYGNNSNQQVHFKEFFRYSSNPVFPMSNTHGNHITYTEVTEENSNSGYIVYTYKNYDNGYADKELLDFGANRLEDYMNHIPINFKKKTEGISMEMERGQVLSETFYDKNKKIKKKITYTYNNDPERFNEYVPYIKYTPLSMDLTGFHFHSLAAGVHYTYFPYLKEKTETEYLNLPVTQKIEYKYDTHYRLLKEVKKTNSDKLIGSTTYSYPHETTGNVYKLMTDKNMLSYPLKEKTEFNNKSTTLYRIYATGLADNNPDLILMKEGGIITESNIPRTEITYKQYDVAGNPTETDFLREGNICFIWSYSHAHPVAKIEGSTYSEIKIALGESFLKTLESKPIPTENDIQQIRTKLAEKEVLVTTYTYQPLIGLTSVTSPDGIKTTYSYDNLGRLLSIKDNEGNLVEQYIYHYGE